MSRINLGNLYVPEDLASRVKAAQRAVRPDASGRKPTRLTVVCELLSEALSVREETARVLAEADAAGF